MANYDERPQNVSKNAIQFAQACMDMNSASDLADSSRVDRTDCENWDITGSEWRWAIGAALYAKMYGGSIMDDGRVVI